MAAVDTRRSGLIGFAVVGLLVLAWLAWISVSIAREPVAGEPSPGELSSQVQQAITARDADGLGRLLDYPRSDAPDFAQHYLDALGPDPVTVTPDVPRRLLSVGGRHRDVPFTYTLRIVENSDGRWLVSFLPPV